MRADRLISTLLLLQRWGRMSARRIADELEVSPRTVMRDLEALGAAGVPVYAIRGPNGGFELRDGFRTQLTGLTADEVASLPLWGHPAAARAFGLSDSVLRGRLKIGLALPAGISDEIERMESFFLCDQGDLEGATSVALEFLATSIVRSRVIRGRHESWGDHIQTINPLALVDRAGVWHLVADVAGQRLVVGVDGLSGLATTGRRFHRPEGFILAGFWSDRVARRGGSHPDD